MKKQYIKFIEGNQESLDKACKLAEKHGYTKWENKNALKFEWKWVLECDEYGDFHVTISSEEELIEYNYTELKEPEWVYVSGESEEDALKCHKKRILITTLPGKAVHRYVCVCEEDIKAYLHGEEYNFLVWKYAVPVPTEEKKERKLLMGDSEWEEFKSRNNIKE
mgnify:CR=1 FL=1